MKFIQRYFGVLLLISCLVGMVVPPLGDITPVIVLIALAFIIFCSFFQINFSTSTFSNDFKVSVWFWLLRFLIVPVAVFYMFKWISEFYALVFLLSFILPAAVSSPSFSALFGGKPDLSLKILVYSSFMAVITIPFLISLLVGSSVQINQGKMLMTLVYTIIVPFIVHLPLRKLTKVRMVIDRYNALFTLAGLSTIFIIVTARNRPEILENIFRVGLYSLISLAIYCSMYFLGYYLMPKQPDATRRTFAISSGANNIGLGVTITALFFPGDINIFFIVSQLIWVVMLVPLRRIFTKF